jgi:hypothetical protein
MTAIIKSSSYLAKDKLLLLLEEIIEHDSFGEIRIEVNILKRKQKEDILHCGKQYRFVVDTTEFLNK